MKVTSFSSDARTQHVFGWVSIIWLASAVSVAVSERVTLQTATKVAVQCGRTLTLTCEASPLDHSDIKSFYWLARNESVCEHTGGQNDSKVRCERTVQSTNHKLTLTVLNVMPVDEGQYLCKLRSIHGPKWSTTVVTVQDCIESSGFSLIGPHAKCWFSGVYPRGTIHWFQGDVNLTDPAATQEEEPDHLGRYNITSTIDVQPGNRSEPYTCSLWIPSAGKHLSSQQVPLTRKQLGETESSGSMVKLQWICLIVEIMMVKFMI